MESKLDPWKLAESKTREIQLNRGWQDGSAAGVIATKPNDLSSIPGTRVIEGENQFWQTVLWYKHRYVHT